MATTTTAAGTLMKKIHSHETLSTNQPPKTGPSAIASAVMPDQVPIARPRCSALKVALMSAKLPGTRSAALRPWTALARMSCGVSGASPHHTDAAAKATTPTPKVRRRP